ncbi:hypothetical protein K435DRAFT_800410 [Dendrothele bispora CBS 962.96]|uniref:Uncharacterized protein n=1 Tax=Dendrothele bispora (strain CBS 962.96) TaxID=1314807 RepID=A0A4S8LSP3_DENBC|nr:hypothetical protein K435DRAFT_800410 [Dendrothele bispora CBS 962.96]
MLLFHQLLWFQSPLQHLSLPQSQNRSLQLPHTSLSSIPLNSSLLTSARPGNCDELLLTQSVETGLSVDSLHVNSVTDPLPSQLLKLMVEDKYVDFDKVHGAIGQSSSVAFYDDPKDFLGDLKLLRSDQLICKLAVVTEAQWLRTYDAWLASSVSFVVLILLVPLELTKRFMSVMLAVHLSWSMIPSTFLCSLHASPSLLSAGVKRSQGTPAAVSSSKRSKSICENWNLDFCKAEKCLQVSTPKTAQPALISSLSDNELVTTERVLKTQLGTRTLAGTKRKLDSSSSSSSIPHFRRGYSTLHALKDYIKVDTPFDVNRLERLLFTHPNRPFVNSVLHSLREGFWPFYEAEWKDEMSQLSVENYSTDPADLEAI